MTRQPTISPGAIPALGDYDLILINSSAGKDSQAALDVVATAAQDAGVTDRLVVVHADLGRLEWPGTRELAAEHAVHYGLRFEVVRREITDPTTGERRPQDLLEHIEARGKWPDAARRFCTSDHKRAPSYRLMTALVRELGLNRQARILNVFGFRAEESTARARREPFRRDDRASNGRRHVDEWSPIHTWTTAQVWERIATADTRPHPAYAAGMPRLSCRFCVLASRSALVRSAQLNPELAAEYAATEARIGHRFPPGPGHGRGGRAGPLDAGPR
jgi:3'-phosphoadenosine 5'-phosphosulfate sulfotransferase (PAPS reductase)/FAD synthetase